ncbi:ComEC/Rec2 family competence protein [Rhizobium sp. KVB221]|uniref:ComEC/Rec2 family competence protein n=2 Tax=Rhizobium setariae TaxID=2801340 RepID=A0A936YRQ7_9HYPH|nr:ComEC/Rec2 family competence protein [Rhizobium setariae]
MGIGAVGWFGASQAPALSGLLLIVSISLICHVLAGHFRPVIRGLSLMLAFACLGALLAAWQTHRSDVPVLDSAVTTTVRGIVRGKEVDSNGRWRYEIQLIETERPHLKRPPALIRVTSRGSGTDFDLGAGIEGRTRLSPPSGPALAGLNDFAFDAYFDGVGAFGYFYGDPQQWSAPSAGVNARSSLFDVRQALEALRNHISGRIKTVLPGDTGAFAASMVTDDRRALSKQAAEALRSAGLAHIIAISGLNMALAAGISFVGLRLLLSLSQEIAHRWPVKKIAAVGALLCVTGYYLISGFAVSAERAFIMMAIMLTAALVGRPSISLRNVALSALVILILTPSAVMGPGFQMSFAATLALVAGYAAWQQRALATFPFAGIPLFRRVEPIWHFAVGIFMTSLIGGLSTALYSIEHFYRIAAWGLPANLIAMPVISFIVMPTGLAALVLMPFGLDWPFLVVMGWGLDVVLAVATWAASLSGDIVIGRIPGWLFIGVTAGLIVMAIMRSHLRFLGAGFVGLLLAIFMLLPSKPLPLLLISEDGELAAIVSNGRVAVSRERPSSFIVEQWQRALRIDTLLKPAKADETAAPAVVDGERQRLTPQQLTVARKEIVGSFRSGLAGRFTCLPKHWCAASTESGFRLVVAENGGYAGIACELADIVVTPARLKWDTCRSGARLFTGETLRRSGAIEIHGDAYTAPEDLKVIGAFTAQHRPWGRHRLYDWRTDTFVAP